MTREIVPKSRPPFESSVGAFIRQKRLALFLSATQLALRIGIRQPYLSQIETGKAALPPKYLTRFRTALTLTPEDMTALHEFMEVDRQQRFKADGRRNYAAGIGKKK